MQQMAPTYALGIINCRRYNFKRQQQAATWCRDLPADVAWFHVVGGYSGDNKQQQQQQWRYSPDEHLLEVACDDGYDALPAKVYLLCAFVATQLRPHRGLIRVDDDVLADADGLLARVERLLTALSCSDGVIPRVYAGCVVRMARGVRAATWATMRRDDDDDDGGQTLQREVVYCRGVCNYLSPAALAALVPAKRAFFGLTAKGQRPFSTVEDVCMGAALADVRGLVIADMGAGFVTNDAADTTGAPIVYDDVDADWRFPRDQARYQALYSARRRVGRGNALDVGDVHALLDRRRRWWHRWPAAVLLLLLLCLVAVAGIMWRFR